MKILSTSQIHKADEVTVKNQGITSIELMERAATMCYQWIDDLLKGSEIEIIVFCGVGNNGGDGLVISRLLLQNGYTIAPYIVDFSDNRSNEFLHNYELYKALGVWPNVINTTNDFPIITENHFVVDAIFGIGLSRRIDGFTRDLIHLINQSQAFILSIDIPSGVGTDISISDDMIAIRATHVLTFQVPKLAFFLPQNGIYLSNWELIDIGLDVEYLSSIESNYQLVSSKFIKSIYKPRFKFSHKGTFGHVLVIGGSYGKIGAISLTSKAVIKSGAGLVTTLVPSCGYEVLQVSNPEVMVETHGDKELISFSYSVKPSVIAVGPGMGTSKKVQNGFVSFLESNTLPLVLDADALNILSIKKELMALLPKNTVLTPHPKELQRLIGIWEDDIHKLKLIKEFSKRYSIIVVLKGAHTAIVSGDEVYFNNTGNSALATAGSGDVLTGIITSLIAQNYTPFEASILGVYLHGVTSDIAVGATDSVESFTATAIISNLGQAFLSLKTIK